MRQVVRVRATNLTDSRWGGDGGNGYKKSWKAFWAKTTLLAAGAGASTAVVATALWHIVKNSLYAPLPGCPFGPKVCVFSIVSKWPLSYLQLFVAIKRHLNAVSTIRRLSSLLGALQMAKQRRQPQIFDSPSATQYDVEKKSSLF